ncbi:MAG TPA: DUF4363 family protein [Candidatus Nitrosocosmicus sp.]|nr:DUF4363 family protein [Candidatus Nitrosocosmicus sp.]
MKPLVIIAILTILLIAGGCLTLYALNSEAERLSDELSSLEEDINNQNWDSATEKLEKFHEKWDRATTLWSMLIDHNEIDSIELVISKLVSYVRTHDKNEALAQLSSLKALIKHIPEKESFNLKNIF